MKKNFSVLLLILSNILLSQTIVKETYTVYLNYPNYTVKANVWNDANKIKTKDTLTYFWYASNKIIQTQGGYEGRLLHGLFSSFFLNSNLREKGSFNKGLKDGQWFYWYENGKLKEIVYWKNGLRDGLTKEYDNSGILKKETSYKLGVLNGFSIEYDKSKKVISKRKFKNGVESGSNNKKQNELTESGQVENKNKKTFKTKKKNNDTPDSKKGLSKWFFLKKDKSKSKELSQ